MLCLCILVSGDGINEYKLDFAPELLLVDLTALSGPLSCVMYSLSVPDPGKGVCGDPVGRVAILEVEGPGPPVGVSERQLSPDRGGEKT
jgi:hypothetical protein